MDDELDGLELPFFARLGMSIFRAGLEATLEIPSLGKIEMYRPMRWGAIVLGLLLMGVGLRGIWREAMALAAGDEV